MNLETQYMGLKLRSPIVVSACTLSEDPDNILRMEDAGAGAVVMFSLFEEQITREVHFFEYMRQYTSGNFAEASDYFPELEQFHVGSSSYLEAIRKAKERVKIPVIASLNGTTDEGWIEYSRQIEQAGADGIEINVFFIPADVRMKSQDVEQRYLDIVRLVRSHIRIPIALKLNPYFSAMGHMASRLCEAGANSLVLFNRFYQPDIDIHKLELLFNLEYSHANEIRLPLLWIAALHGRIPASLAATTGIQSAGEVIKYLLAGADVTMTASALYKHGIPHLSVMNRQLAEWMEEMQFQSVEQVKGIMSQQHISDPTQYERANYIRILESAKS